MNNIPASAESGSHVTIVTRTKDRPLLLARAIASVLAQEHQDWHLYIVNDGGQAEPVEELVRHYQAALANRITIIHHEESKGMEAASNAALSISMSDFIVIHDDDDSWNPAFLKRTVAFLKQPANSALAAVATNTTVVNERIVEDLVIEINREPLWNWRKTIALGAMMVRNNNIPPICLLIRRSVVNNIGFYNPNLPVLGDWDYNLRILTIGDIGTINIPLAHYHHRKSLSPEADIYANSVGEGETKHTTYGTYYTNSLLRPLLQREPGYIGLLNAIMQRFEEQDAHFDAAKNSSGLNTVRYALHEHLGEVEDRIHKHLDWEVAQSIHRRGELQHIVEKETGTARYAIHEHLGEIEERLHKHIEMVERRLDSKILKRITAKKSIGSLIRAIFSRKNR